MDATVNDLVATIGEQTVELRLLRQALASAQEASNLKEQEMNSLKAEFEVCKSKSDGLEEIMKHTGKKKGK